MTENGVYEKSVLLQSLQLSTQYAVFCSLLFVVVMATTGNSVDKEGKPFSKGKMLSWYSRAVSIVHALIMFGRSAYYWYYVNPTLQVTPMISSYQGTTMDIMVGYLIYDTCFEMYYGEGGLILAHHLAGLLSHILGRYLHSGPTAFYLMMVYIAELSTPFLHICWILKQLNITNIAMTICGVLLIISFFLCRVALSPFLLGHMWFNWTQTDDYMFHVNFSIASFFLVMNYYWFFLLVKVVIFPGKNKTKQQKDNKTVDKTKNE